MTSMLLVMGACSPVEPDPSPRAPAPAEEPVPPPLVEPETVETPTEDNIAPYPPLRSEPCSGVPSKGVLPLHPDLQLRLESKVSGRVELPYAIEVSASIRNGSKTKPRAAVLTGDGSAVGWREPHVWYSGFVDTGDGCWRPIVPRLRPRCGHFDRHWVDDVVSLEPGEEVSLESIPAPETMLDVQRSGRIRVYLHYAYRSESGTNRVETPTDLGAMEGVDAFELMSEPVEFEVLYPLELTLSPRDHVRHEDVSRMSDAVELRLENLGSKYRRLNPVAADTLEFEILQGKRRYSTSPIGPTRKTNHIWLDTGESVSLLGAAKGGVRDESPWVPTSAGVYRIRASYYSSWPQLDPPLRSDWVELELL